MKINKIFMAIAAAAVLSGSFVACSNDEEFLKEKSYKFDDNTFYNTEKDMEMGLTSCYQLVQYMMTGAMRTYHSWMPMGLGLDTFTPWNGDDQNASWQNMIPTNGYSRHWMDYLYRLINRCNTVIDLIDERPEIKYSTDTKKNELRGEAVLMRAWSYRLLAALYGNIPILDHRTTETKFDYAPNTRQEIWEFMKTDLEWAEKNLPKKARQIGTVTAPVAGIYLAEVNLALGNFQEAIDAATRVISKQDGDYNIMTTRFGSRKNEQTDRYGNKLNPYWDLFRGAWGRNGDTGQGDSNPNAPDNKEALWVAQFNYGTYSTGGGGDSWGKPGHPNVVEACWSPNGYNGLQTTRTKKSNGDVFYFYGNDAACYAEGVVANSKLSTISGCEKRHLANIQQDSLGGRVSMVGTTCIPTEYVYGDLWKDDPNDFRGCETMIQRNFYLPGGQKWYDAKAEMYARAKAAVGTPDEEAYRVNASDTTAIYPRYWKFTDDCHPNGDTKQYDVDWYILRFAEVYLLRAEAYLALGDKGKAADDINVLRDRAQAKRCSADQIDIDYILDERTRELIGEEMRWVTLNRLSVNPNCGSYVTTKYPVQDATTSNTMYERVRKYGFGYENNPKQREAYVDAQGKTRHYPYFWPHNYQHPIPVNIIQSNSQTKYPQNPGY